MIMKTRKRGCADAAEPEIPHTELIKAARAWGNLVEGQLWVRCFIASGPGSWKIDQRRKVTGFRK
jgi:hypothetical protein